MRMLQNTVRRRFPEEGCNRSVVSKGQDTRLLQIAREKVGVLEPGLAGLVGTPGLERMAVEPIYSDDA